MNGHRVSCRSLILVLDSRGRVLSLRPVASQTEWLAAQSSPVGLWQLGLIRPVTYSNPLPPVVIPEKQYQGHEWWANRDEYLADLELDSSEAPAPEISGDETSLTLYWTLAIPDGEVKLSIRIEGGERERLEFRINVNLPESWAIKRVTFPRIRGFGNLAEPDKDALLYPETWGVLRRNPLQHQTCYSGQYPAHINWCQMLAWLHEDQGVYLGILDPDSHHTGLDMQYALGADPVPLETDPRNLHLTSAGAEPGVPATPAVAPLPLAERLNAGLKPSMQLRCQHWPPMRHHWQSPYPVVLQGFRGSWYDAAVIHRNWATKQRWCRRGKLAERKDASSSLAGLDLWFSQYGFPPGSADPAPAWDFQRRMHALQEFFQLPFGIHWYHWHHFSWHSTFPGHSPPVEGFETVLRDLQDRGIVVMPYCQGRLLYRDRPDWEHERMHASVEANGQPYLEQYTPQDDWPLALCPGDSWSRQQWIETARMLWRKGVDGVYFDQITAMPPSLCYHADHDHEAGGGNQYWHGYDQALAALTPEIQENPQRFLSSELMADAFLDRIDLYLSFMPPLEDFVPLHPAIYGDYTTVMGRSTPDEILRNPQLLAICQGEQLLFGGQLGWMSDAILSVPKAAEYLRDLARLRRHLRDFLHYGTLARPIRLRQEQRLRLTIPSSFTGKGDILLDRPAVRHTVWQAPDGRLLLLLLNEATTESTIQITPPAAWPGGIWRRRILGKEQTESILFDRELTFNLPAFAVLTLESTPKKPAVPTA